MTDDVEPVMEEADEWTYEADEYDYESEYMTDDVEPATEEVDEWTYEYESEYVTDDVEPVTEEADDWTYEYDYEAAYATEEVESVDDVEPAMDESDEWAYESDYESDWMADDAEIATAEPTEEESSEWRSTCDIDGQSFGDSYACPAEEFECPAYVEDFEEYQGYSEAYPEEDYAYPEETVESTREPQTADFSYEDDFDYGYGAEGHYAEQSVEESNGYDYAEPYDYYGHHYYSESMNEAVVSEPAPAELPESGLELFAWHPTELLLSQDQEAVRELETLCQEPSGVRRATLNDYLESLGWEAIDFASRFEDVTGIEVLGLADDLPGTAALLGVFRLVERGELGTEEAVDLLRRSVENLSIDWIEGVDEITADAFQDWVGYGADMMDD